MLLDCFVKFVCATCPMFFGSQVISGRGRELQMEVQQRREEGEVPDLGQGVEELQGLPPLAAPLDAFDHFDPEQLEVQAIEPVDSLYGCFGGRCFVLYNVLSEEECQVLISSMATDDMMEAVAYQQDYRRNDRVIFASESLALLLWKRVQATASHLAIHIDGDGHDCSRQRLLSERTEGGEDGERLCPRALQAPVGCHGLWEPMGLNERFRLCRYRPGGFFRPHCDGIYMRSQEEMSLFTCMFYLDSSMEGGATKFLKHDAVLAGKRSQEGDILASVRPRRGMCLLFFQPGLLHEGEDVHGGVKHILRTEVMFRRKPGTGAQLTERQEEALRIVREAEAAELSGSLTLACDLYRRAFKMDPSIGAALLI